MANTRLAGGIGGRGHGKSSFFRERQMIPVTFKGREMEVLIDRETGEIDAIREGGKDISSSLTHLEIWAIRRKADAYAEFENDQAAIDRHIWARA
jgi:hypothetical protein